MNSRPSSILQLGTNLLSNKGGIYQAVRDYETALGGTICSVLDPKEPSEGMVDQINYFLMGKDPVSRLAGRVAGREQARLFEQLASVSHLFLHGSYRLTAAYALHASAADPKEKSLFYIPHGSLDPWVFEKRGLVKRAWVRKYGGRLSECANGVLAMTHNELRKIQKLLGVRENQRVIYLPLDLEACRFSTERSIVRARYGIPESARLLCYLGRLHEMKRPIETVEAIASVRDDRLHLVVVGPEDTYTCMDIEAKAEALGVQERVHVTGPVYGEAKYALLNAADAYISLSHRENFNYTAAEGLGTGRPVILSPGNDLQGEISDIDCGWMLKTLDTQEVKSCLGAFLQATNRELGDMGGRGKSWVEENLSFERFQQSLQALV